MRIYILIASLALFATACKNKQSGNATSSDSANTQTYWDSIHKVDMDSTRKVAEEQERIGPKIVFEEPTYNFGTIKAGEKVTHNFKFTNEGKAPLIITEASATCGCTVPEYPKQPIKPGEKGVIKVIFNSTGKSGVQSRTVTIFTNNKANPSHQMYLVGEIIAPNK